MSFLSPARDEADRLRDLSPIPPELQLFARIEGLVGEEAAILEVAHEQRNQQQHERLRVIAEELDQIWQKLRERAERGGGTVGEATSDLRGRE